MRKEKTSVKLIKRKHSFDLLVFLFLFLFCFVSLCFVPRWAVLPSSGLCPFHVGNKQLGRGTECLNVG